MKTNLQSASFGLRCISMKTLSQDVLFLFCCFIFLVSCQEEVEDPRSLEPNVQTVSAQVLNEGGVNIFGELSNFEGMVNHGFLVTSDTNDWAANSDRYELGKPTANGKFQKKVVQNILTGRSFYFKAFIQTGDGFFYGKPISFVSKGGLLPTIERVEPEKGHLDEMIKVYGERFGIDVGFLKVFFDDIPSQNYLVTDNRADILLPYNLVKHEFFIRLIYYNGSETKIAYSLATPVVHEVIPEKPSVGAIITLKGNHFDRKLEKNEVFLGGIRAEIIQCSREELKVKIPEEVTSGELDILVNAQLQSVKQEIKVKLNEPILESFPAEARVGQELEVKGKNFNPVFFRNKILINGFEAQVTEANTTSIKFLMPDVPYPDRIAELSIKVAGMSVSANSPIKMMDSWVMVTNELPFYYFGSVGSFVIDETAYVMARSLDLNDNKIYLYKFNSTENSWTKLSLPFLLPQGGVVTQTKDKAYIYTMDYGDNFWEYDPKGNTWIKKAEFPGERRTAFMFHAEGKIYLGPGVSYNFGVTNVQGFYVFDNSNNSWKKLNEPSFTPRSKANSFVFGEKIFVFEGANDTGDYPVYKYDVYSDSWIETQPQPSPRNGTTAFQYRGKGYTAFTLSFGENNLLEFDPVSERWSVAGYVGYKYRKEGFSFVVNDTVYVGGGDTGTSGGEREMLKWVK